MPGDYHSRRVDEMRRYGADIVVHPGDYEAAVAYSRKIAEERELYDANPGGDNTMLQLKAYGEIAYEILSCDEATATVTLEGSDPVEYSATRLTGPFPCADEE